MNKLKLLSVAKPILFDTDELNATLDGKKTELRQIIKPQPIKCIYSDCGCSEFTYDKLARNLYCCNCGYPQEHEQKPESYIYTNHYVSPYNVDDTLYVKESWCKIDNALPGYNKYIYKANETLMSRRIRKDLSYEWHAAKYMPKEAARIFVRVIDVRAERLREIDKGDAATKEGYENFYNGEYLLEPAIVGFVEDWDNRIPQKDISQYGWNANPWVWVIRFERVEVSE